MFSCTFNWISAYIACGTNWGIYPQRNEANKNIKLLEKKKNEELEAIRDLNRQLQYKMEDALKSLERTKEDFAAAMTQLEWYL